jgi:hypothetical protein
MSYENVSMVRGDTMSFGLQVQFDDGVQPLDTAYFTCKANYSDINPVFQKSLDDGIDIVSSDTDSVIYRIRVAPEDTKYIEPKNYYYDFQIGINHDIFTVLRGILKVDMDITEE